MKKEPFLIPQALLKIAGYFPEESDDEDEPDAGKLRDFGNPGLQVHIKKLRELMPGYTLSDEELVLIAILFERFLDREKRVNATELADRLYPDSVERLHVLKNIRRLVVKGLIDTRGVNVRMSGIADSDEEKYSLVKLVESEVLFREAFLQDVMGERRVREQRESLPYQSNREFLEGWFSYIKALKEYRNMVSLNEEDMIDLSEEQAALRDAEKMHKKRLSLTKTRFPLQDLFDEEELDEDERNIVVYLLREHLQDNECTITELVEFISRDNFEMYRSREYFEPQSKMVSRGILELAEDDVFMMRRTEVRLALDVSRRLLTREPENDKARIAQVLRCQDILKLETPRQSFDDLVLPEDLRHKLDTAIRRYEKNVDARLREWESSGTPMDTGFATETKHRC